MAGNQEISLADDLLRGAKKIADFFYGSDDSQGVRRVYHAAATGQLPIFKMGATLCARRSTLRAHIADREKEACPAPACPAPPAPLAAAPLAGPGI